MGYVAFAPTLERIESTLDRLVKQLNIDPDGCWTFTGHAAKGYGSIRSETGRFERIHRVAYRLLVEPIADELELDHICRVPRCCNPDHLEPVTHRVNVLRSESTAARRAQQTHCQHGHEFTEQNTSRDRRGHRRCRACHAAYQRARRAAV